MDLLFMWKSWHQAVPEPWKLWNYKRINKSSRQENMLSYTLSFRRQLAFWTWWHIQHYCFYKSVLSSFFCLMLSLQNNVKTYLNVTQLHVTEKQIHVKMPALNFYFIDFFYISHYYIIFLCFMSWIYHTFHKWDSWNHGFTNTYTHKKQCLKKKNTKLNINECN